MRRPAHLAARARRGDAMTAALVVGAVMAAHTLARDHLWRFEWRWAVYQYHFGTILAAPLLAGLGAWAGCNAANERWLARLAGRPRATLVRPAALGLGAVLAYAAGASVPAVIVVASGTADRPSGGDLLTFGPALGLLAASLALGVAAGARFPRLATPPLAAAATFGLQLAGWVTGGEALVRVGGAGASMTSLRPSGTTGAAQLAWFAGLAVCGLGWAAGRLGSPSDTTRGATAAGAVLAVVAVAALQLGGLGIFDHPRTNESCTRLAPAPAPRYCVAAPYRSELRRVAHDLDPTVRRLASIGVPLPRRIHLGSTVALFEHPMDGAVRFGEVSGLLGLDRCLRRPPTDDLGHLWLWLALLTGDRTQTTDVQVDPGLPDALASHDPSTRDRWAAAAYARLRSTCS